MSARLRRFLTRHPALLGTAFVLAFVVALDRIAGLHAVAMVLACFTALSVADAWDEETKP